MRRLLILSLVLLLVLSLALTGCGKGDQPSTQPEEKGGENTSNKESKVLTIAQGTDIVTFDTQNHLTTSTDNVLSNMTNRLLKRNNEGEIVGDLAESYKLVNDTTWSFKLKEGVKFHNGDPLTAKDVKFTLERAAKDESLREYPYFKGIKEVKILDDYNFEIITYEPMPTIPNLVAKAGSDILPKDYIEKNGWEYFLKNPVYSGPYKFVEWRRDDRVVVEPFEDYFGEKPKWEKIVFRTIPEVSTRVGELLTGGVDLITDVPPNEWERVNNSDIAGIVKGGTTRIMLLVVRTTEGTVTADKRVREAIDLAIDNKKLTETLLAGAGTPTRTRVAPGTTGANTDLYNTYLYDPEKAKQLLAEAGYPNGLELTMYAPRGRYLMDSEVAQMIAGMLNEVGIKVNLEIMEWSNFVEVYKAKKNKELLLIGLGDNFFDASYPTIHYSKARAKGETDFNNDEADSLYQKAIVNMNPEERVEQFKRIQEIAAEERPHIFLYQLKAIYGVNDRIDFTPRVDELIDVENIKLK